MSCHTNTDIDLSQAINREPDCSREKTLIRKIDKIDRIKQSVIAFLENQR